MNDLQELPVSRGACGHASELLRRDAPPVVERDAAGETRRIVFVVDDDSMMASLIGAALEGAGYLARVFTSGTEAIALAATLSPDLLLVDLTMPELSGVETMARLRKLHPALPALVISGVSGEEARAAAPEADGFLEKPFRFSMLLRAVASLSVDFAGGRL